MPDLRLVEVAPVRDCATVSTAVYPIPGRDVVAVQGRWPVGGRTAAVVYSCAVEQYPRWREHFSGWVRDVSASGPAP